MVSFGVVMSCQILLKMYLPYFPETFLNVLGSLGSLVKSRDSIVNGF